MPAGRCCLAIREAFTEAQQASLDDLAALARKVLATAPEAGAEEEETFATKLLKVQARRIEDCAAFGKDAAKTALSPADALRAANWATMWGTFLMSTAERSDELRAIILSAY